MMDVARFDDFDRMVRNDHDGAYVLFEDYDSVDKECAVRRATIQQLEAKIVSLEADVDRMAWKTSPAMAQATIDQLVKQNEQLEAQVKELEIDGEEYRQYAMEEVRKACQEAGVLVDADDSICISKAGDIAMKVKQLEAQVKELGEQVNDFHCRLTENGNHGAALLRLDDLLRDEAEDLGVDALDTAPDSA